MIKRASMNSKVTIISLEIQTKNHPPWILNDSMVGTKTAIIISISVASWRRKGHLLISPICCAFMYANVICLDN